MISSNTDQSLSQDYYVKFTIFWENDNISRNNIITHELFKSDVSCLLNINYNLYDIFVYSIKKVIFNKKYEHLEMNLFDRDDNLIRIHDSHETIKKVISWYSTELENFISSLSISLLKTQWLIYIKFEKVMMTLLLFRISDLLHDFWDDLLVFVSVHQLTPASYRAEFSSHCKCSCS